MALWGCFLNKAGTPGGWNVEWGGGAGDEVWEERGWILPRVSQPPEGLDFVPRAVAVSWSWGPSGWGFHFGKLLLQWGAPSRGRRGWRTRHWLRGIAARKNLWPPRAGLRVGVPRTSIGSCLFSDPCGSFSPGATAFCNWILMNSGASVTLEQWDPTLLRERTLC